MPMSNPRLIVVNAVVNIILVIDVFLFFTCVSDTIILETDADSRERCSI